MKRRDFVVAAGSGLLVPAAHATHQRGLHAELFKPKLIAGGGVAAIALRVRAAMQYLTESGDATAGWNYTHAGGGDLGGVLTKVVGIDTDFSVSFKINHPTPGGSNRIVRLGLTISNVFTNSYNPNHIWGISAMGGDLHIYVNNEGNDYDTGLLHANGDTIRMSRIGTVMKVERDPGSTGTFTQSYTHWQTLTTNVIYYLNLIIGNVVGTSAFNLRGAGLIDDPVALAIYNNLVGWWDFEENSATHPFYYDSHAANDLTAVHAAASIPTAKTTRATGKVARGFNTDHPFRAALIPRANSNLDCPNSDWSFGCWVLGVNVGGGNGWTAFVAGRWGRAGLGPAVITITYDATAFRFNVMDNTNTNVYITTSTYVVDNTDPRFVVVTFDRTNNLIRIRVKSAAVGTLENRSIAFPNPIRTAGLSTPNFAWGHSQVDNDNEFLTGTDTRQITGTLAYLDGAFFVNKALTDTEFNLLYNQGPGLDYTALVGLAGKSYTPDSPPTISYDSSTTDPLWGSVKFSIPFTGANNATTATDRSSFARALTFYANAKIDTSDPGPFNDGAGVLYLDGVNDCVTLPDSDDWSTFPTSVCCEGWFKNVGNSSGLAEPGSLWGQTTTTSYTTFSSYLDFNGVLSANFHNAGGLPTGYLCSATRQAPIDAWFHWAAQLDFVNLQGGWPVIYLYINGRCINPGGQVVQLTSRPNLAAPFCIGNYSYDNAVTPGSTQSWKGWMAHLRYTSGATPRYPAGTNFTVRNSAFPTAVAAGNPSDWNKVSLLIHGDQRPWIDVSSNQRPVANYARQLSLASSAIKSTNTSTSQSLIVPADTAFVFGTGSWTLAAYVVAPLASGARIYDTRDSGLSSSQSFVFSVQAATLYPVLLVNGVNYGVGGSGLPAGNLALSAATRTHVAMSYDGTTLRCFVAGALSWSHTVSFNLTANNRLVIANSASLTDSITDQLLDELIIVKGEAVYTSAFTPPSRYADTGTVLAAAPNPTFSNVKLLVHGSSLANGSTAITDSSTAARAVSVFGNAAATTAQSRIGTSSIDLDGTGDYLTVPSSSDFAFGTGDYSVEVQCRATTLASIRTILSSYTGGTDGWSLQENVGVAGGVDFNETGDGIDISSHNIAVLSVNTWAHIAAARSGTNAMLFIEGECIDLAVDSQSITNSIALYIGRLAATLTTRDFTGQLQEIRVIKGETPYKKSFIVQTAAHPNS